MSKIKIADMSAGLACPKCGGTEFETADGKDTDVVTCKNCGHEGGTLKEVRAQQVAAIKKQAPTVAKKALQDALKGVKGFKPR